jgi:hypothetical protein
MPNGFYVIVTGGSLVSRAIAPGCNSSPRENRTDPPGKHRASTPHERISAWFQCKSKGDGRPARADRAHRSGAPWADLGETLHETTGTKVAPGQAPGLVFRVRETALVQRALAERMHNESDDSATRCHVTKPRHGEVCAMAPDLALRRSGPPSACDTSTFMTYTCSVYLRQWRLPEAARSCLTAMSAR